MSDDLTDEFEKFIKRSNAEFISGARHDEMYRHPFKAAYDAAYAKGKAEGEGIVLPLDQHSRWGVTIHLGYCNDTLTEAAIHKGTMHEVAQRVMSQHDDGRCVGRTYPLGEQAWPVGHGCSIRRSSGWRSRGSPCGAPADLAAELRRRLNLYRQTQGINSENAKGWEALTRTTELV